MIKRTIQILVLGLSMVGLQGCNCNDGKIFTDLFMATASITNPIVAVATPFLVRSVIQNVADEKQSSDCSEEDTYNAEASQRATNVQYRQNEFESWQDAQFSNSDGTFDEIIVDVLGLDVNEEDIDNDSYNFQTPGQYRFGYEANYDIIVPEVEGGQNNNFRNTNQGNKLAPSNTEEGVITVIDPEGKGKPYKKGEKVTVIYLGTKHLGKRKFR